MWLDHPNNPNDLAELQIKSKKICFLAVGLIMAAGEHTVVSELKLLQTGSTLCDAEAPGQCASLLACGSQQCQSDSVDVTEADHKGEIKKKSWTCFSRRQSGVWQLVFQSWLLF